MERESIHGNDVSSRAGLPVALCHSQRNSKLSGLEASARLVTQDAGAENGLGVARRVDQQQLQGTAEVLLRSGPRSSTPPVHEFIQKPEKPATLVAPRLAAGSGGALKQKQASGQVVRRMPWVSYCRFFQDAAQAFLRRSTEMRRFPGGGIISPAKRAIFDAQDLPRSGCRRC